MVSAPIPVVFWKDEYTIDDKQIDQQHEHIVALTNALEIAAASGEGAGTADLVLAHLVRFLATHFDTEERAMEAAAYPDLAEHRQQHAQFSRRLAQLVRSVESGELNVVDCVPVIRDWLHCHLLGSDQRFAFWVRAASNREVPAEHECIGTAL